MSCAVLTSTVPMAVPGSAGGRRPAHACTDAGSARRGLSVLRTESSQPLSYRPGTCLRAR
eukprot:3483323-Rhodomonas_salina.1